MSLGSDRLAVRNTSVDHTAADIRNKPSTGVATTHALFVKQYGTSGNGQALVIESDNSSAPVFTVTAPTGGTAQKFNGALVVAAVAGAPETSTLPLGASAAARNTGIMLVGSFAGGEDNSGGTDSTPRINIYSYQRAATHSFGEIQRMWLMRKDSKAMLAWYGPQLTGTQTHGYDADRNALTTGVSWKPWAWLGAHYEANDHASTHGHISIEVPDADGALQTRFEIQFADRTTGAIGLDKSFIISNDSDFAIRQSGGESFRIVAPAGTEKRIDFMGDAHGDDTTRRWKLRSTSTAESGSDAGSDFELVRYNDAGTAQSATFIVKRSNGYIGFGSALSDITAQITAKTSGDRVLKASVTAEGTASVPVVSIETTTTGKRAFDYRLTNDGVSRLRIDSSASSSGTITFGDGTTADTNLYRSAANTLKTDDALIAAGLLTAQASAAITGTATVTASATTAAAYAGLVTGDTFDRIRVLGDGTIEIGPGNGARDTNVYRGGANLLKTDDKFAAVAGIGVGNSAAATTLGSVTRKIEVFDATGASLGFVPVYNAIT